MNQRLGFRITGKKGFHITFENGWTVSVQFGPGNYCDNYNRDFDHTERCASEGSTTAECAVWDEKGKMAQLPGETDTVTNRSEPKRVLEIITYAASQPDVR